jgi:hypothetical protein
MLTQFGIEMSICELATHWIHLSAIKDGACVVRHRPQRWRAAIIGGFTVPFLCLLLDTSNIDNLLVTSELVIPLVVAATSLIYSTYLISLRYAHILVET